jgi:hypothetical protein
MVGFPRLHVFNDSEGKDPLLEKPVVLEKMEIRDNDYINGALYSKEVILNSTGGQLYYRLEVVEERDPDSVFSPLLEGPVIDANPPKITILEPVGSSWISSSIIRCSVKVEEMEGAFVLPKSIKLRKSTTGPDHLEKGLQVTDLEFIDNNTYIGHINVRLDDGKENYIQFEAMDGVRNLGYSEPLNIWIDTFSPYYTGIGPRDLQLYESVNCTIDWLDHYPGSTIDSTGLDLSSIKYSYKTTSGPYSEWLEPDGLIELAEGIYRAYANIDFENEGVYNYIRWMASDNIGNTRYTDDDPDHPNGGVELKINVQIPDNYPPVFKGSAFPGVIASSTPHFYWDGAYDEEGDRLYYRVMILKNDLQWTNWIDLGQRTFYDVSDSVLLDPDWYVLRINVTDTIGGFDLLDHDFRITDRGTPPPEDIPKAKDMYTADLDYIIEWDDTPSWAYMNITYWLRIGTEEWMGDVIEWTPVGQNPMYSISELGLGIGIYFIQYMAENNGNFSRVSQSRLKVNDYNLEAIGPQETFRSYRGKGDGFRVDIYNWATFTDNVTVLLSGEAADREWVYLNSDSMKIETDRDLTVPSPEPVMITVFPPRDAKKGSYTITLTLKSEDGETLTVLDNLTVKITDKETEGIGGEITDTLYDVITDVLPFLESVSQEVVVGFFLLIVAIIVGVIATLGIFFYRSMSGSKDDEDPYSEQRRLYKELYGTEPTIDQLKEMKEGSVVDEVMSDLQGKTSKGNKGKVFDESFLDSEGKNEEPEE